ncbi:MAG: AraC family transcriptional regulator [Clostridia bacterium]|nr:AraC family transcriptional regulator [Clostridia bacterium]
MDNTSKVVDYKNSEFYFLYLKKFPEEGFTSERWHEHSFYEIMFIAEGENEYVIENRRYVTKEGDVLLIKPGSHHFKRRVIKSPSSLFCLGFLPEAIQNSRLAESIFDKGEHFSIGKDSVFYDVLNVARKKLELSRSNAAQFIKLAAESALLLLGDLDIQNEKVPDIKNPALQKMLNHIKENLTHINKVEDVAHATFFSESYTRTLFKKEMGIGIMEYVRNKKILLAHRKIRHGRKPTEVYAECGFSNYPSFYRAYLSYFGYSPKEQKV